MNSVEKSLFRMVELWMVNAMCLYFHANPDYAKKRQPHKKFTIMWIHDLVQQLLHRMEQNECGRAHSAAPQARGMVADALR